MNDKELHNLLDLLVSEINTPYSRAEAKEILFKLMMGNQKEKK